MGIDPISITAMTMAATAAGAATSAAGAYEQGQARSNSANYQAQVAANNAQIAQQNEQWEIQGGEERAGISEMRTRAAVGTTKAAQAAAGVDVNTGSAVDVRAAQGELGMLDALTIRTDSARKAYGYAVAATSDTAQSQLLERESSDAARAGELGAATSLISGAAKEGTSWLNYQKSTGVGAGGASDAAIIDQALSAGA